MLEDYSDLWVGYENDEEDVFWFEDIHQFCDTDRKMDDQLEIECDINSSETLIYDGRVAKSSRTMKTVMKIDYDTEIKGREIYVVPMYDVDTWEDHIKTKKFDFAKNEAIHLISVSIGVPDTGKVYIFGPPKWEWELPGSTHGWVDEIRKCLQTADTIHTFDADRFYGCLRFYLPYEMEMMRYRLKTIGMAKKLRGKPYKCWKQPDTLAQLNPKKFQHGVPIDTSEVQSRVYSVRRAFISGKYLEVADMMRYRCGLIYRLFRLLYGESGLIIPNRLDPVKFTTMSHF